MCLIMVIFYYFFMVSGLHQAANDLLSMVLRDHVVQRIKPWPPAHTQSLEPSFQLHFSISLYNPFGFLSLHTES